MKIRARTSALTLASLLLGSLPAAAQPLDGVGLTLGQNPGKEIDFYRLDGRKNWGYRWFEEGAWSLTGRFEFSLFHLSSDSDVNNLNDAPESLSGASVTPMLRYERQSYANGIAPFVELGVGIAYFSDDKIEDDSPFGTDMGSRFQFEDKISAGVRFGDQGRFETALTFIHYSNADLASPNEGMNTYSLGLAYWF